MPDIHFYLRTDQVNKKGFATIFAQINIDTKKFRKTIEKAKKHHWNTNKQRLNASKAHEVYNRYIEINAMLDDYEIKTRNFFTECLKHGIEINDQIVKDYMNGKEVIKNKAPSFFEAFKLFIEAKKPDSATRTIKGYTTIQNYLKDFQKKTGIEIIFKNTDLVFFDELKKYSFEKKKIQDNYFAKIIAILKTFLNWCEQRNYTTNTDYKRFSFAEKDVDIVFLTLDELLHLNSYEFESEKYNKVRDLFCFGCFTGLRYSDIQQLKHEHIVNNVISKKIQKKKGTETIQLNDLAIEILKKYKHKPLMALPKLSHTKANKYIKEACKIAEINTPTVIIQHRGSNIVEMIEPKHKLIKMHTGRKTFITLGLILGMNVKTIMSITGHKKDATFNKYLKITEDYQKVEIDNTWNKVVKK